MISKDITVTVNGRSHSASVMPRMTLVDFLRDVLRQTGTHIGCEHGVCGACSVIFDGVPIRSCLMYAVQADGHEIMTVEGLAEDGRLGALQQAFLELGGAQCGICTPGMLMAAAAHLDTGGAIDDASLREALAGNICRCTGYTRILDSVKAAATKTAANKTAPEVALGKS